MAHEHIVYLYPSLYCLVRDWLSSPFALTHLLEAPFCLHFALSRRAFTPSHRKRGEERAGGGEDMHSWKLEGGSVAD